MPEWLTPGVIMGAAAVVVILIGVVAAIKAGRGSGPTSINPRQN